MNCRCCRSGIRQIWSSPTNASAILKSARAAIGVLSKTSPLTANNLIGLDKNFSVCRIIICSCGNSSVVERDLAKVEVASSNLVSRSKFSKDTGERRREKVIRFLIRPFAFVLSLQKRRRSQVVRQSSAKALFISSILIAASN